MNCQDILVDRNLNFVEISAGISQVFYLSPSEVLVLEDIPAKPIYNFIRILCQIQDVSGDFKQLISIYFKDVSLSKYCTNEAFGHFCNACKCVCLISNESVNPYSMTMIRGVGNYQTVYLSPEFLEEEKYVLVYK